MTSEKNNDLFEVFGIIVNENDYNTEHLQDQYKTLVENYIRNSYSTIEEMIENYRSQTNSSLFAVIKFFEEETDHHQYWINLNIIKFNGKLFGFIIDPGEGSVTENEKKDKLKKIIIEMIKEKIEFIDYNNRDECDIRLRNIEIAFSNIEIFINFLKNERKEINKNFQGLKFFRENNQSIKFEKLIVELGLSMQINAKPALKKILAALKSVTDRDSEYKLPKQDQLKMLSSTLTRSNFSPRGNDKVDLKQEVISLLTILKDRGQEDVNEEINKNIEKYFEKNRNKYQEKIDEFNKKLKENSRDKTIQGCLDLVLKDRMEYLININKLHSDSIILKEINEFMKFFDNKSKQKELEIRKNQLENDNEKIPVKDSIEINDKLSDIRKELDYYARISEITKELNFNDFIIILGANNAKAFPVSQEVINIILEIGITTENNKVASAIVKILNFSEIFLSYGEQRIEEIRQVLDNVLPRISFENTDSVLELSRKLKVRNNSSLLKFLYKVLIENENSKQREEAFEILRSLKVDSDNLKYINKTIQLEKNCREKNPNIIKDCLAHVRLGNQLTMNCFEKLKDSFDSKEISEIIQIILEQDLQELPRFFIEKFLSIYANYHHRMK